MGLFADVPTVSLHSRPVRLVLISAFILLAVAACTSSGPGEGAPARSSGIGKIKHVIIITQENRSFDRHRHQARSEAAT
jgi:phospholipase C